MCTEFHSFPLKSMRQDSCERKPYLIGDQYIWIIEKYVFSDTVSISICRWMSPISKHWFVLIATFKFEQTKFCPPKLGNPESQLSSIKVGLSLKVVFYGKCFCYQRLCSIKGHLPSKVVSHQRLSSIKGRTVSKHVKLPNPQHSHFEPS